MDGMKKKRLSKKSRLWVDYFHNHTYIHLFKHTHTLFLASVVKIDRVDYISISIVLLIELNNNIFPIISHYTNPHAYTSGTILHHIYTSYISPSVNYSHLHNILFSLLYIMYLLLAQPNPNYYRNRSILISV